MTRSRVKEENVEVRTLLQDTTEVHTNTVQIREVWPGRPGYQGLVWCVLMADTVVRHCSSPITVIVYTKYFAKTNTVIGEEQCRTTVSAIKTHLTRPWYPVLPGQTFCICTVLCEINKDNIKIFFI